MVAQSPLQLIESPLAVIGFNAIFNDLENIDQVEASLYRGESLTASSPITASFSDLCKQCANRVLESNNLTAKQIAVIVVNANSSNANNSEVAKELIEGAVEGSEHAHFSYETVTHLAEALICSEQIIKNNPHIAVLIITASLDTKTNNVSKATISFDEGFDGYASLQGAACLLLSSEFFVQENNSVCYSTITNVTTGEHADIEAIIAQSLKSTLLSGEEINALEVSACINNQLNELEQKALIKAYSAFNGGKKLTTAISCQKSVLGDNGALSELMGLIHTVISLQQRYRPCG